MIGDHKRGDRMDDEKNVLTAYHYECEGCKIDFSVSQGRHYNVFEVCCPICKTQDFLIRWDESAIVLINPQFVQAMFGEGDRDKGKRKASNK